MRKMCKGKGALLVILLLGVFLPAFLVSCNGGGGGGESTPAPVAGFSALPTTGPATLAVAFTDSSTGRITDWSWDFGDGGTSTDQNPSHNYATNGTYTVALTVTGPGGDNTATQVGYINVTPLAQFSGTPTSGDAPLTVTFTNASTGTDGSTTYAWDFGDGGTSALQNPTHVYTDPLGGNYTVTLTATGPGGSNTNTKPAYINTAAAPAPVAGFSGTPPLTGEAPLTVTFTDSSTGVISDWSWDFGDGGTSTAQNPTHNYTTSGTYTVALTVTGPGGSDTATQVGYVNVTPLAQFSGTPTSGDVPLTVTFTDLSTGGATSWSWDFGDGGTSALQNPTHDYTDVLGGNYTVSLTATGPGGSNTNTKPAYINTAAVPAPVAGFSGTPLTGEAPLTVTFTDESTGVISGWSWDFGDGGTSPDQNPAPYTYTAVGTYTVALTVTGPGGDNTASITDYIDVVCPPAPLADFLVTETSGPVPLTTSFEDASTGYITEWLYDFGDGSPTSTDPNPANHVYTENGIYSPSLTVTGPCASDTNEHTGQIEVTPNAEFLIDTDTGPAPLTVTFIDNTTGINLATWEWDFGDGGTFSGQDPPPYDYVTPGTYTPSLTVTDVDGLVSTVTHMDQIEVTAP